MAASIALHLSTEYVLKSLTECYNCKYLIDTYLGGRLVSKSEIVCSVFFTIVRLGAMSPTDVSPKRNFLNEVSRYDPSLTGGGGGGVEGLTLCMSG
jgi:hypothetical protein